MTIKVGNAPCSWGVEFAGDPRNPPWKQVLAENEAAGYTGIELGPVGFMPEDPSVMADALAEHHQELIGGVVYRPFHDASQWDDVMDGSVRTCEALKAHGAKHLVLIDSIAERRAPTAGRGGEAEQMDTDEWVAFRNRIVEIAKLGTEQYGLSVAIHPHAGGFIDFEPEIERLLGEVDASVLKLCVDTGHQTYAGINPVALMKRHVGRLSYVHFKDIDAQVKRDVVDNRTGFYDACGQGIFCKLGDGEVDFHAVRQMLLDAGFEGWCTVEQDCDPTLGNTSPVDDARYNRDFLKSIGF